MLSRRAKVNANFHRHHHQQQQSSSHISLFDSFFHSFLLSAHWGREKQKKIKRAKRSIPRPLFSLTVRLTLIPCIGVALYVLLAWCRHSVGDTKVPFCLQSCIKPLEYAIAIHELGSQYVHRYVDKEPSGLKFNKLSLNDEGEDEGRMPCCCCYAFGDGLICPGVELPRCRCSMR